MLTGYIASILVVEFMHKICYNVIRQWSTHRVSQYRKLKPFFVYTRYNNNNMKYEFNRKAITMDISVDYKPYIIICFNRGGAATVIVRMIIICPLPSVRDSIYAKGRLNYSYAQDAASSFDGPEVGWILYSASVLAKRYCRI